MSIVDLAPGTCGCCRPPSPGTPEVVHNRPALDEVAYRVGRYATFREAMIRLVPELGSSLARDEGLSEPPLGRWTSRQSDDYGVALIEMWATIGDILTFYQERYANEAWLRTAGGRDAIRRLAGLLGYRLAPGVAAETHLAYVLDDGVDLDLGAGLRAQSVPKDGENPQKYETAGPLEASSAVNRFPVYAQPMAVTPLVGGSSEATLEPGSSVPLAGDAVLAFTNGGGFEERTVAAVVERDGRTVVRWTRPLGSSHSRVFVRGRSWRLFGSNAPESYLTSTPSSDSSFLTWESHTTDFDVNGGSIDLDGTVDGIEPGVRVLIDDNGVARLRTVEGVSAAVGEIGATGEAAAQTGPVTRVEVSSSVTLDVRTTVVYELLHELDVLDWELPTGDIPSGTSVLYVPYPEVSAVEKGRLLVVDDGTGDPMLMRAEVDAVPYAPGGTDEFLAVTLETGTTRTLDGDSAFALGNVVKATHGETVAGEILGDGAASQSLQAFTLKKDPVTFTSDPRAMAGARSSVVVDVDRVRWTERSGLYGAGSHDRVFTTEIDDDGKLTVRFGDGRTGARLPTGRGNVIATYRTGIGLVGNVDAGQITTALDKPTGLAEVVNPVPASGGADPETVEEARTNAPNTVRTFDRAISVTDFADLAREYIGVAKAHAGWVWDGEERVVYVTVAGDGGASLGLKLADLRTYLDLRRDPNRAVRIGEYRSVPFLMEVEVQAAPDHYREDVAASVRAEIDRYFAFDARDFGQAVHLSDLYAVVHAVEPVVSATITRLTYERLIDRITHGVGFAPVAVHAPIFGARHISGTTLPAELAVLDGSTDLTVTVTGGLVS